MITRQSTYDECVAEIDASAREVAADLAYGGEPPSEDEVWTDLASALLIDADPKVAREVCRCQLGFIPVDLARYLRR